MSDQLHLTSVESPTTERWRVIALVGDKYNRDIDDQLANLDLGFAFTDAPETDTLTVAPDTQTINHYLDYSLDASSREAAIDLSVVHMFEALRNIGLDDETILFARIGKAAASSTIEAVSEMDDVTDLALAAEHDAHLPDYVGPEDFEQ